MANTKISQLPTASALTGSELVPVVQAGFTKKTTLADMPYVPDGLGAVTTTVQTKLRETVSVKDFGAVGDGVADDTAAIQAAINYVKVNQSEFTLPVVYLPKGTYRTTSELYIEAKPIRLFGDGATIKNSVSNCLRVGKYTNPGPEYSVPAVIEGIVFYGFTSGVSYTGQSAFKGVVIEDSSGAVMRDCYVWGFNVGIYNYGGLVLTFDNVQLRTNITAFQGVTGTFSLSNFINFLNCKFYENKVIIEANGGSYSFKNCTAERNNPTSIASVTLWNFTNLSGIAGTYCLEMDNVHCEDNNSNREMYINFAAGSKTAKFICSNFLGTASTYGIQVTNGTVDLDQVTTANAGTGVYIDSGAAVKARSCNLNSVGGTKTNYYVEHATGIQNGDTAGSYYKTGGSDATFEAYLPINGRWGQSQANSNVFRWMNAAGNRIGYSSVPSTGEAFDFFDAGGITSYTLYIDGTAQHQTTTAEFRPGADNAKTLGNGALRWSVVYAATGTINTSDKRTKQQIRDLLEAERNVAVRCKSLLKAFKFNDAVQKKGSEKARWHFGIIAQEVSDAFEAEGLNAHDYALLCYDEWADHFEDVRDQDGNLTGQRELIIPAGNRYGIRYDQLLAFIISAL